MTPITDFETFSPEIYLLSRNVASPLSDLRSPAANLKARFSKSPPAPPHKIQSDLKSNERFSKSLSFLREPTLRYCKALVVLFVHLGHTKALQKIRVVFLTQHYADWSLFTLPFQDFVKFSYVSLMVLVSNPVMKS